jgi:hypothetical protein
MTVPCLTFRFKSTLNKQLEAQSHDFNTYKYVYSLFLNSTAEVINSNVVSIEFVCGERGGGFNTDMQHSSVKVTKILSLNFEL